MWRQRELRRVPFNNQPAVRGWQKRALIQLSATARSPMRPRGIARRAPGSHPQASFRRAPIEPAYQGPRRFASLRPIAAVPAMFGAGPAVPPRCSLPGVGWVNGTIVFPKHGDTLDVENETPTTSPDHHPGAGVRARAGGKRRKVGWPGQLPAIAKSKKLKNKKSQSVQGLEKVYGSWKQRRDVCARKRLKPQRREVQEPENRGQVPKSSGRRS